MLLFPSLSVGATTVVPVGARGSRSGYNCTRSSPRPVLTLSPFIQAPFWPSTLAVLKGIVWLALFLLGILKDNSRLIVITIPIAAHALSLLSPHLMKPFQNLFFHTILYLHT